MLGQKGIKRYPEERRSEIQKRVEASASQKARGRESVAADSAACGSIILRINTNAEKRLSCVSD